MSGSLGLQGRYATSYTHAPLLGVGRYSSNPRGQTTNALLDAAGSARFNNPPPSIYSPASITAPDLMMLPMASAAPVASGGSGGGMDIGNALLGLAPAAALLGGRYLYNKLTQDNQPAGTGVSDNFAQTYANDAAFNAGLSSNLAPDATLPLAQAFSRPGISDALNFYGYNAAPAPGAGGLSVSDVAWQNSSTGGFPDIGSLPDNLYSNIADSGGAGMADGAGAATSWNPLDWSITTPGTGAFGLDVGVGPLTFNPVNMAAGALGSWGGSELASTLAPYSGIGQTAGSSLGGIAGGALLGAAGGPIGALVGAFLGSLGGGTIGADSPNYPYSYFGAQVGNGTLDFWNPAAMNGGDASSVQPLTNALRDYVTGRMSAEGLTVNPYMGGQRAFSAGVTADPGGKFFVGASDINPSQAAYGMNDLGFGLLNAANSAGLWGEDPSLTTGVWRGNNVGDLPGQVWQQLLNSGAIGMPGSFSPPAPPSPADIARNSSYTFTPEEQGYNNMSAA